MARGKQVRGDSLTTVCGIEMKFTFELQFYFKNLKPDFPARNSGKDYLK